MTEEITYGSFEYRSQGWEIHRRPIDRTKLSVVDASWLVMNRSGDYVPPEVRTHFIQARDRSAVY